LFSSGPAFFFTGRFWRTHRTSLNFGRSSGLCRADLLLGLLPRSPAVAAVPNAPLGHFILFLARMICVLPTSVFGFVFIAQRPEFEIPVFRCLVLLLGLFALFCYVRELERLGRVFTG
jgi:hypothetical protein